MQGLRQHIVRRRLAALTALGATLSVGIVGGSAVDATGDQIEPGATTCFRVDGEPGDVAIVNLTPVNATSQGWGVLESSGAAGTAVGASVNYSEDSVDPNVAMAEVGSDGQVCFRNSPLASVHLVADQLGSISSDVFTSAGAGSSNRILDTRDTNIIPAGGRVCAVASGEVRDVAVVNIAPVDASGSGSGVLVSSDVPDPGVVASVNFAPDVVNPNLAIAEIGPDGQICFANGPRAAVHVVLDQIGTIDAGAINMAGFDGAPVRVLDTRDTAIVGPGGRACARVNGFPGDVAVVNITPIAASGRGNGLLISSDVVDAPVAANVNYSPGSIDPNVALAVVGLDGEVCFANANLSNVHVVMDQLAVIDATHIDWWSTLQSPVRVLDTRVDQPTFPPETEELVQGGRTWAVVLAAAPTLDDPSIGAAVDAARRAGYGTGPTDCDAGAAAARGLPPTSFTVSVYYETEVDATLAQSAFVITEGIEGVVAEVQTFCLD